ncbi:MAG: hypothetical protein HKN14_02765 [Marinicaulis sp.]|nr:hypothetical protein [Marinicaulis sp.]NNL88734.1 hypothetical protein [Marinicaulis sp.]
MKKLIFGAMIGAIAMAGTASANIITVSGSDPDGAGPDEPITIDCAPSCEAFTGAGGVDWGGAVVDPTGLGTPSMTLADVYDGAPAGVADELMDINTLAGTSFTAADYSKDDTSPPSMFTTMAAYIGLKLGPDVIYLINTSGGALMITVDTGDVRGSGLSHITEFGEVEIPVPGAIWLMVAGIAGLGFSSRKKKA